MKVFVDFDDVLFNTGAFVAHLKSIFADFGINEELFTKTYEAMRTAAHGGNFCYRFDKHVAKIREHKAVDEAALIGALEAALKNTEAFVFADSKEFLRFLTERGHDVRVLSFGDQGFQTNKIQASGIELLVNEIIVTNEDKETAIGHVLGESTDPAYFFDDRVFFLESVKKVFPQVTTVLVQRSEGRFRDTRTLLCDQRVATLDEAEVFFE
jgi:FMN phosphatase YigB (HAD superfamily)